MTDEKITTTEAAEILGVSVGAVSRAINRNRIKATKFGRTWIVSKQSVLVYKEQRQHTGPKKATSG